MDAHAVSAILVATILTGCSHDGEILRGSAGPAAKVTRFTCPDTSPLTVLSSSRHRDFLMRYCSAASRWFTACFNAMFVPLRHFPSWQ